MVELTRHRYWVRASVRARVRVWVRAKVRVKVKVRAMKREPQLQGSLPS